MAALSFTKLREDLAEILNKVTYKGERIVITRHRKEVAAVISIEDLRLLERIEEKIDIEDGKALIEALKRGDEESDDWNEVKDKL